MHYAAEANNPEGLKRFNSAWDALVAKNFGGQPLIFENDLRRDLRQPIRLRYSPITKWWAVYVCAYVYVQRCVVYACAYVHMQRCAVYACAHV